MSNLLYLFPFQYTKQTPKSQLGNAASFPCKLVCNISELCMVRPAMNLACFRWWYSQAWRRELDAYKKAAGKMPVLVVPAVASFLTILCPDS